MKLIISASEKRPHQTHHGWFCRCCRYYLFNPSAASEQDLRSPGRHLYPDGINRCYKSRQSGRGQSKTDAAPSQSDERPGSCSSNWPSAPNSHTTRSDQFITDEWEAFKVQNMQIFRLWLWLMFICTFMWVRTPSKKTKQKQAAWLNTKQIKLNWIKQQLPHWPGFFCPFPSLRNYKEYSKIWFYLVISLGVQVLELLRSRDNR